QWRALHLRLVAQGMDHQAQGECMNTTLDLRWQMLALFVFIGVLLYFLAPVLTPFAVAAMFAYLFDPLTTRLVRLGVGRTFAVCIVFFVLMFVLILVLILLIPYLSRQIATFIAHLPAFVAWAQNTAVPWLNQRSISISRCRTR